MKEANMITILELLKRHIFYNDGFWIYRDDYGEDQVVDSDNVRAYIREQQTMLEKDIGMLMEELTHNRIEFDIDQYLQERIAMRASTGKSRYFASLDKLYPGNKFREIMNYYLFSKEKQCFILVGYGQTGKTTFVNIINRIVGEALCGRSNVAMLKGSHGTASLEGKIIYEVAEAQDLDLDTANLLKSMITNDIIGINPKFERQRMIKPHVKMIMTCNNMPRFRVSDDGIIRRFITVEMNNKIKKQDNNFMNMINDDIPNIIGEALLHPFNIEDFAEEQYYMFQHDPQYGFGYGIPDKEYIGGTLYENYRDMCRACGYMARNKANFEKYAALAKIYQERIKKCDTTSKDLVEKNGFFSLSSLGKESLPF